MNPYLTSAEAAHALGVRKATLYSYVSRGLIQSFDGDGRRERKFRRADIERLARSQAEKRKPKQAARSALNWGLPVMESSLTLIEHGNLYYRGIRLEALLPHAHLEDVAHMLWQFPSQPTTPASLHLSRSWQHVAEKMKHGSPIERMLPLFALGQAELPMQDDLPTAEALLQLMAACMLGTAPSNLPLHEQCAKTWHLDARGCAIVNAALLCCADHELNASSFTARAIASTGVDMGSAVTGALAALRGPLHGGYTERIETLFDELAAAAATRRAIHDALAAKLDANGNLPGFGHLLYPDGDPRAIALLAMLPANRKLSQVLSAARQLSGQMPTLDFALVALRRYLELPRGAAFGLFALARTVGWIAHFLEQHRTRALIRPRASYVGPRPPSASGSRGRIIRSGGNPSLPGARQARGFAG